ncbi:MAG TPA: hypothetical protein VN947_34440 [Polyangia bacterium]|nr:hypothetical protein [Polyangia bacterium]
MRALRVPRSGSMVLSMLVALLAIFALPFVFLGALSHSADAHPPSMRETLASFARPVEAALSRGTAYCRRHLQ